MRLKSGGCGEAVGLRRFRVGAGLCGGADALVALDDERRRGVDHVEVADRVAALAERIEPGAASPFLLGDIELDDAERAVSFRLLHRAVLQEERAFEQAVELAAVG